MKFLVFGASGFIGSNLVKYLRSQGEEVLGVSRSGSEETVALDITKGSHFSRLNFVPDVVVHCASIIPSKNKTSKDPQFLKDLFLTNVVGAVNVANWVVENNVPKLINCSTLAVIKKPWPLSLSEEYFALPEGFHVGYAMSKISQEQIMSEAIRGSCTRLLHLRLSAVYGVGMPPMGLIYQILEKMKSNEDVLLTDAGKNTLDLINVHDVCRTIFALANKRLERKILNVAKGEPISIIEMAKLLKKITGSKSRIVNTETSNCPSRANIDIGTLRRSIDKIFDDFIPIEIGLKNLVENA